MEKLINFIEMQLKWAKETPENANSFFHNAFGALQFYIVEHSLNDTDYAELESKWNHKYRPLFEGIIYAPIEQTAKSDNEWRSKPGNPFI